MGKAKRSISFKIISTGIILMMTLMLLIYYISYVIFGQNIQKVINLQTNEISRQIVYNYENYIGRIIDVSNLCQVNINNVDVEDTKEDLINGFQNIVNLEPSIIGVALYSLDGKCLVASDEATIGEFLTKEEYWFKEAIKDESIHIFSGLNESSNGSYIVTFSKYVSYNNQEDDAVLKIILDIDSLIELVYKTNLGAGGHITIIDSDYNLIYSSNTKSTDAEIKILKNLVFGTQKVKDNGYSLMVNLDTISNTQWRIATFINIDQIESSEDNFLFIITIILIGSIAISILLLLSTTKTITSPLKQLENEMLNIEKADYLVVKEINFDNGKEVANLSRSFNKMMKKIKELMDKIIVEQNEQRKSELKALQHQINPHFLYNTLDSTIWLIENQKNEDASKMIVALSKFFRISISRGNNIISVSDEIEHAKNYLLIQSIRYSKSFDYEFEIEEECLKYHTMKLILQPIIENAIYHGLKNKIDKGHIKIKVFKENETLAISVSDNGYGMRQEKINELYENFKNPSLKDGVGLKNIYQRLLIYFSGNAQLLIESKLDFGTTITVMFPPIEGGSV